MLSIRSYFHRTNALLNVALHWWLGELGESLRLLGRIKKSNFIEFEVTQNYGVVLVDGEGNKNITGLQNISLKFNDNAILYRKIKLPAAAHKNIDKVVHYEFNKYFPMNVEDALISCEVIEPNPGEESIEVEIWSISQRVIDTHLNAIREQYGIEAKNIYIRNSEGRDLISVDISKSQRLDTEQASTRSHKSINIMILALLLALLVYPILKINMQLDKLRDEVALLETEAQPIIEIRENILEKEARFQHLISQKKENSDQAYIWSRITRYIADKAILNRMVINGKKVLLEGKTPSVERIIKIFESDKNISEVKIIGSVATIDNNSYETMNISLIINN